MARPKKTAPRQAAPRVPAADLPALAVAHVVATVRDVRVAAEFYRRLGLRPVWLRKGMAILELRGGTHLLLFPRQRGRRAATASFDLMAEDLDAAHAQAEANGLSPRPIEHQPRIAHRCFTVDDPDGHRITIYSSHTEGRPV